VLPAALLQHTPFATFRVPGALLGIVVGGSHLACAALCWRRSAAALGAGVLAGGALLVWIAAEIALLRALHPLHVVYAAAGAATLGLALAAARRARSARLRWIAIVTAAEAIGYLAPTATGIALARAGYEITDAGRILALAAAGLVEGAALGAGQALALPIPVSRARYIALTAAAAALVWTSVMSVMALGARGAPPAVMIGAGLAAAVVGLLAIGGAQWLELRRHAPRAARWIPWTALAWAIALPASFAPGPLVDEATPLAAHVVLWGCGGLLMAFVMAAITWRGVRALTA
jgi:hypothetical protein